MKYIGLLFLAVAFGILLSENEKGMRKEMRVSLALGRLFRLIEREIGERSSAPSVIARAARESKDGEIRLLACLIEDSSFVLGLGLRDPSDQRAVEEYFQKLGRGSKEVEVKAARDLAERFEKRGNERSALCDKRIRALRLVYGAALVCALILIA